MDGDPWGGSEELWWGVAMQLLAEGQPVCACVQKWLPSHPRIQKLQEAGADVLQRPKVYPLWKRGARALLRSELSVMIREITDWLRKCSPALVVLNEKIAVPHFELMEMCIKNGWPFVFVSHSNAEFWWAEDTELERYRTAVSRALKCYFVSNGNLALAQKQVGIPRSKVSIVRNPFNADYRAPLPWPAGSASARLQMACVGRLDPRSKGQDLLFEALSKPAWRDREWRLNLYGAGRIRHGLERLVDENGVADKVTFKGHQEVKDIWADNHILVLPSRAEGLPITIVEAMLCGRPVLTTDVAGNAELLEDEVTGFIVDAPTVKQVGAALEQLWECRDQLEKMGAAAATAIRRLIPPDPVGEFARELKTLLRIEAPGQVTHAS